jgi:hypothetical protein
MRKDGRPGPAAKSSRPLTTPFTNYESPNRLAFDDDDGQSGKRRLLFWSMCNRPSLSPVSLPSRAVALDLTAESPLAII